MDREDPLDILKHCFSGADNMRIVCDQEEDGKRHYSSEIHFLTVEYDQNRMKQRKHVVLKVPTSGTLRLFIESLNFYEREITMYKKVIPRLNEYLYESLAPVHLYTTESKILVFEDLTACGYESGEKLPLLEFSQARAVMRAISHFHAASRKLYEEDSNLLTTLLKPSMNHLQFEKLVDVWGVATLELLKKKNKVRLIPTVEAALSFFKRDEEEITATLDKSHFKFVVLNHGDSRKDNVLFKEGASKEVRVRLVDYQCCFWSSPAFDVIYFMTTSVSASVLEAHFDDLIGEYLDELNQELQKLKCESTYKRVDFEEDFKTLKFFLFYSFLILCAVVGPLDQEQMGESFNSSLSDATCRDFCLNDENYVNIVYAWLEYFEKSKIFNEF